MTKKWQQRIIFREVILFFFSMVYILVSPYTKPSLLFALFKMYTCTSVSGSHYVFNIFYGFASNNFIYMKAN